MKLPITLILMSFALPEEINYDESKVPAYTLPDPLTFGDGTKITDAETWSKRRRPEILELFAEHVYGKMPGRLNETTCQEPRLIFNQSGLGDAGLRA